MLLTLIKKDVELPWMQEAQRFVPIGKAPEPTRSSFIVATPKGGPRLPFEVEGIENDHVVLSYRQEYLAKEPGQITIDPVSFQCEVATKIAQRQGLFFQNQPVATQTKIVRAESTPLASTTHTVSPVTIGDAANAGVFMPR